MQKIRHWLVAGPPFWLFLALLPVLVVFCWNLALAGIELVGWIAPDLTVSSTTRNYALELKTAQVHDIALRSFVLTPLKEISLLLVAHISPLSAKHCTHSPQ